MRRLVERAPDWLSRKWVPSAIILLSLLLVSPCLSEKLACDDYLLLARLDPRSPAPGLAYAPLDLFALISGDPAQRAALMEEGFLSWWAAPDLRAMFWRPLSSLTHLLDFLVRPRSAFLAHAHSMLWFAALLAVLLVLYRRLHVPWVAHLALLLYAVDDAHGMVLSFVANRNALVAATLAFAALLAHDRARRDAWRPGLWLAPALFGAALLGGEAALAVTAYLLTHALFIDQGPLARRLARLWPFATLAVVWLAAYKAMGYGTRGTGFYDDPSDGLVGYLGAMVERLPVLLAAQLGFLPSDVWPLLPRVAQVVVYGGALTTLAVVTFVLGRVLRRKPVCRFWAVGAVLSLPPTCAALPADRLLVFAGVGAMAAIAMLLADALLPDTPRAPGRGARMARRIVLSLLALVHLVMAPLLLPMRALTMTLLGGMIERVDASIPRSEDVRGKTLVVVNGRVDSLLFYLPVQRAVLAVPRPRRMRILSSGVGAVRLSRLDATTLRVRPAEDFLESAPERMARSFSRPFHPGDEVALSDVRVRVSEVTADGRPAQAEFFFDVPLEDPSLLWMRWQRDALAPYSPPAVGESHVLPPIDMSSAPSGHAQE